VIGSTRAALCCLVFGYAGCSRADLYPVTGEGADAGSPSEGGGARGGGGSAGSGSGGRGGGSAFARGGSGATAGSDGGDSGAGGASDVPLACPSTTVLSPGDSPRTLLVGGVERSYVLHLPPGYDGEQAVPLVLDFHGVGKSGADERASSPYPAALDPEGVVMAFPDGLRGPAGTAWNVGPCCVANVDDVAFARAVVADVRDRACIDGTRVYAVGILTGGGMAHYLGCHAADVFAAVAPAAFDLLEENVTDCIPSRPVTVVSFRGMGDSRVPYEGGPSSLVPGMPLTFLGATMTFEKWAEIDGCTAGPSAPDERSCQSYSGCLDGAEVILCTQDGGALLPGDPSIAWPVLKRHVLGP
jgi:polyhydroxybutyrate depolymerase